MTDSAPINFWSVTTLIGAGVPKEQLIGWAARIVAERAYDKGNTLDAFRADGDRDAAIKWLTDARWETTKTAAERGTNVHSIIEAYALGNTPVIPEGLEGYDEQIQRFLEDHSPKFEAAEAPVYNLQYQYAGTLDLILRIGRESRRVIVDAKTTNKLPDARSRPPYAEVGLQLAAYSRCSLVGVSPATMREISRRRYYVYDPELEYAPMPELDGAFALVISPVDYRFVPVRIDDEIFRAFLAARAVAKFKLETSRRVFGPEVTATSRRSS